MAYNAGIDASQVKGSVSIQGPSVRMHATEWKKVMAGEPTEINPSVCSGFKVMSVEEWSARWKRNEDYPTCLGCGGTNTKEHFFTQAWCRGYRSWESECLCVECHAFSLRRYTDPEFKSPEEWEVAYWTQAVHQQQHAT